jgi:hypothetical protein
MVVELFGRGKWVLTPTPTSVKKVRLAAGGCRQQITWGEKTIIQFNYFLEIKKNKHHFYNVIVKKLMFQSSHMLCPVHLFSFSQISQKEQ